MENLTRPIVCDILSGVQRLVVYVRKKIQFDIKKTSTSAPVSVRLTPFVADFTNFYSRAGNITNSKVCA